MNSTAAGNSSSTGSSGGSSSGSSGGSSGGSSSGGGAPSPAAWILVVEDDKALNEALCQQLVQQGYRTVAAHKVAEALTKLTKQKFDCVLLDLRFDARSGEQVIEFMRSSDLKLNRETPILVMSGFLDPGLIKRFGAQVSGILVKPFDQKVLFEKVGATLSAPARRLGSR